LLYTNITLHINSFPVAVILLLYPEEGTFKLCQNRTK